MADFKKRANDLISRFRSDMSAIEKRYGNGGTDRTTPVTPPVTSPGVQIPGTYSAVMPDGPVTYTVSALNEQEDRLRKENEAITLEREKTHYIDPKTGQWVPKQQVTPKVRVENYMGRAKKNGFNSMDEVKKIQAMIGVKADGLWGDRTQAAYDKYKASQQTNGGAQASSKPVVQTAGSNVGAQPIRRINGMYRSVNPELIDLADERVAQQKPKDVYSYSDAVYKSYNTPTSDRHKYRMAVGLGYEGSYNDYLKNINDNIDMYTKAPKYQQGGQIPMTEVTQGPGVPPQFPPSPYTYGPGFQIPGSSGGGVAQAYQQGGQMQGAVGNFAQYLAQIFGVQSEQELKQIVQKIGREGLQQLQAAFKQGVPPEQIRNQMSGGQAQIARRGARLCPQGTRIVFKKGGCMCQKMQDGGQPGKKRFTAKPPIKKNDVSKNDTIHVNGKPYDISGGKTKYPRLTDAQYRKLSSSKQTDVDLKDQAAGRTAQSHRFGGVISRYKNGGQMGSEFNDGIGAPSVIDKLVGRPKMKCGGKTKKKLVSKK